MKYLIAIIILILTLPLLAAERHKVSVVIPLTGPDSELADSIEKQVRAADSLMGQVIITSQKRRIIGYVTDDPKVLKDTVKIKVLLRRFPGIKVRIVKIEPVEVLEKAPK